jgi:hypothetical protein
MDVTRAGVAVNALTNEPPHIWRGSDVRIEVAGFFGDPSNPDTQLLDVSNVASIALKVMATTRTGSLVFSSSVLAAAMTTDLTRAAWDDGTGQMAAFVIPNTDTDPTLVGLSNTYHLVVQVTTTDQTAKKITWGISTLTIEEDGSGVSA